MIKILHSADWHLDAPLNMQKAEQSQWLRKKMLEIPEKIVSLCKSESCDMLVLSGDLFDGHCSGDTLRLVKDALEDVAIPVFISPGNHDFVAPNSPWADLQWPENVHIFRRQEVESVAVPQLDCRVYGAAFTSMDCPALLEGFQAEQTEKYAIGVFHGDPTQVNSTYCPITTRQIADSGLDYLALGHIHKGDQVKSGKTLCAWPGCPMGHGYDELGEKGVLLVSLDSEVTTRLVSLQGPQFHDLQIPATEDLGQILPPVGSDDFYRITFIGASEPVDISAVSKKYPQFPNLELRDKTTPPIDVWASAGKDTFEGVYFSLLQAALEDADEQTMEQIALAAKISRQLLDGQEVVLP